VTTKVVISGDSSGAVKAIERVRKELGALDSVSKAAFSLGGAISAAGLVAYTKSIIDAADALNEMSERTGISVENLGKLQYAAKLSGVESEQLGKSLQALSGEIVAAAGGSESSAAKFKRFGVSVQDAATKQIRPTNDVLLDLNDAFALLPEGAERSARSAEFFGAKLGGVMVPFLAQGRAGIEALGDEIERLGGLMSAETAKAAAEFNDNLDRLKTTSSAAGISIANALLPTLNKLTNEFVTARGAGFGFLSALSLTGTIGPVEKQIERITARLKELNAEKARGEGRGLAGAISGKTVIDDIAQQEKLLKFYETLRDKDKQDEAATAAKRIALAAQLQTKLGELEKLRAVAAGKASADILLEDDKRTAAQIANAEKLRDALRSAFQESVAASKKAADEAKKLLEQAATTRATGADKAAEIRRAQLPQDQQDTANANDFRDTADAATLGRARSQVCRPERPRRRRRQALRAGHQGRGARAGNHRQARRPRAAGARHRARRRRRGDRAGGAGQDQGAAVQGRRRRGHSAGDAHQGTRRADLRLAEESRRDQRAGQGGRKRSAPSPTSRRSSPRSRTRLLPSPSTPRKPVAARLPRITRPTPPQRIFAKKGLRAGDTPAPAANGSRPASYMRASSCFGRRWYASAACWPCCSGSTARASPRFLASPAVAWSARCRSARPGSRRRALRALLPCSTSPTWAASR